MISENLPSIAGAGGSVGVALFFSFKMFKEFIKTLENRDKLFVEALNKNTDVMYKNTQVIHQMKEIMENVYKHNVHLVKKNKQTSFT